jgi:hypothetical protein
MTAGDSFAGRRRGLLRLGTIKVGARQKKQAGQDLFHGLSSIKNTFRLMPFLTENRNKEPLIALKFIYIRSSNLNHEK